MAGTYRGVEDFVERASAPLISRLATPLVPRVHHIWADGDTVIVRFDGSATTTSGAATKFAVRAISDGLRQESTNIRVTCVNPGVVESELAGTITHEETMAAMDTYRAIALQPADIARAVRQVIEAPQSVDTTEITIRPTASGN